MSAVFKKEKSEYIAGLSYRILASAEEDMNYFIVFDFRITCPMMMFTFYSVLQGSSSSPKPK